MGFRGVTAKQYEVSFGEEDIPVLILIVETAAEPWGYTKKNTWLYTFKNDDEDGQ